MAQGSDFGFVGFVIQQDLKPFGHAVNSDLAKYRIDKADGPAPITARARPTVWSSAAWAGTRMESSWCAPIRRASRIAGSSCSRGGRSTQRARMAS